MRPSGKEVKFKGWFSPVTTASSVKFAGKRSLSLNGESQQTNEIDTQNNNNFFYFWDKH